MMREEREVVIQFSLIPIDDPMPSSLGESGGDYYAGDITKDGLEELRHKSFLSDSVFNIGMRHGTKMAEYLARMITGDRNLRIEKVLTQYGIENLGHSVRMDALAVDSKGRMIDFEMQMKREKEIGRRMRLYESSFNLAFLAKGSSYSSLPSFTMIWLYGEDPPQIVKDRIELELPGYEIEWHSLYGNNVTTSDVKCWEPVTCFSNGYAVVKFSGFRYNGPNDIGYSSTVTKEDLNLSDYMLIDLQGNLTLFDKDFFYNTGVTYWDQWDNYMKYGFLLSKVSSRYGVLDRNGNVSIPYLYGEMQYDPFLNGVAKVQRQAGEPGSVIDLKGNVIIPEGDWQWIGSFVDGYALATQTGIELIDTIQNGLLKSAELTGQWEKKLRRIEDGTYQVENFMDELKIMVNEIIHHVKYASSKTITVEEASVTAPQDTQKEKRAPKTPAAPTSLTCPKCGKGNVVKGKTAWGCTLYGKSCDFLIPQEIEGKKLTPKQVETLVTKGKTGKLSGFKNSDGTPFSGILTLNHDKKIHIEKV